MIGWLILSLACKLSAPTPVAWIGTPTAEARARTQTSFASTRAAELTAMPTLPPARTATATLTAVVTPSPPPEQDGPWLLYPGKDGSSLHAYDQDAYSDTLIDLPPLVNLTDLTDGLSPDGKFLLLRAGKAEVLDKLGLYTLNSPLEEITQVSPLLSIFLQQDIINNSDENATRAMYAVSQEHGISWSGDGKFLAFTAGLDTGLSDIYLFDITDQSLARMTERFWQNVVPFWSPENNWLIFQEAYSVSQQAGWEPAAVFGVSLSTFPNSQFFYAPSDESRGEVMVGWLNDEKFLSYSRGAEGGFDLRQVDIMRETNNLLFEGNFSSLAFDPINKTIALLVDRQSAAANNLSPGIYTAKGEEASFTRLIFGEFSSLEWSTEGQIFTASGAQGLTLFDDDSVLLILMNEQGSAFSPAKSWLLAWNNGGTDPGLRLYTAEGVLLQTITDLQVNRVIWQPDSKAFYFTAPDSLFRVNFPLLIPVLISTDVYQGDDFQSVWLPEK